MAFTRSAVMGREAPLLSQLCPQVPPRIPGVPGVVGALVSMKVA